MIVSQLPEWKGKERDMAEARRKIEIFSAGCPVCNSVVARIEEAACPSCDVRVLDMRTAEVQARAERLGVRSVPAVAIDGKLADCCSSRGVDMAVLRAAGLGRPVG